MKKDAGSTIKRAERFQVILIGEGLLVGTVAGFIVLMYRIVLEYAGSALSFVLDFIGKTLEKITVNNEIWTKDMLSGNTDAVYTITVDLFRRWWSIHHPDITVEICTIM